jgi:hypothetical protein
MDQGEFLRILQQWGDHARSGKQPVNVAIVDAEAVPTAEDETLAGCEQRISQRWKDDWFLYLGDGVHLYNGAIWERAVELVTPAIRLQKGFPSGGMMLDLFFGQYRSTPSGIHLDTSDNLAFIVQGPKRIILWPNHCFTVKSSSPSHDPSHQGALTGRYRDHMKDAIVIDANEGDVIYWPKEYWHIAVSEENWSAMVTIPMWWSARPASLARFMLDRTLDLQGEPQLYAVDGDCISAAAYEVPSSILAVVSDVKTQIAERLDLSAKVAWAKFVTAFGFMVPPARRTAPTVGDDVKLRVNYPIVCIPTGEAAIVIACGHQTSTPMKQLACELSQLQVGTEYTLPLLGRLLSVNDPATHEQLRALVTKLVSFRALEVLD